ncbi:MULTISPECIES: hypothetical protein [Sorangium]|uniref:Uncharacterized protein n=1 Tax=Sorangium cellulosum TaxID=56 RepID=A0A4P2R169_SORCE|nr:MULTISPECIES: hypothetical protein [Sorangium]AUX36281.1 hypothetical protein SOCE836_084880 [Sorangium cellulosum]WCQ95581.1 hypothetical protein NQZ70_08358 [Sorangium sp. Soce836]
MRNLTIGDLKLALRDLLDERVEELRLSATGRLYEPRLRARQKEIEAIPEAAGTQAPLARELSEADVRHDGIGAAIFFLCKAVEAHPSVAPEVKAAAAGAQQAFVPRLDVLRAPYADEASAALDNRPELTRLKAELKAVATPGGGSLHEWVKAFVSAGDEIDKLLRRRATLLATGENAAATGPLRGAVVGLLGRFREALRDEIQEEGSKLPADHEARLFAYVDKLNADRERAARARAAPAAGGPAAPGEPAAPVEPAPAEPVVVNDPEL